MALNNETISNMATASAQRAVFCTARDSSDHLLDFSERKFLLSQPDDSRSSGALGCLLFLPTAPYLYKANTARSLGICNNSSSYLLKICLDDREPDYDNNPTLPPHRLKFLPKSVDLFFPGTLFVCGSSPRSTSDISGKEEVLGRLHPGLPPGVLRVAPAKCTLDRPTLSGGRIARTQFMLAPACFKSHFNSQVTSGDCSTLHIEHFDETLINRVL